MVDSNNVRDELLGRVRRDSIASELAVAFQGLFTIEDIRKHTAHNWKHTVLSCKPTKTMAESLLLDREVLVMITNVDDIQVRTLHVARELIDSSRGRLDPAMFIVVHADENGDEKLRNWGREQGCKIVPIFRDRAGAIPKSEILRQRLAQDLFVYDPFSVTGPVSADADFFGRKTNATDTLRQLERGGIISLFGIRKVGKTSLINRVINLAREGRTLNVAMIDCSVEAFYSLSAPEALSAVAKIAKMAATRGYAHITEALKRSDAELIPVFDDLWSNADQKKPLALIFDEVDYITPASPTRAHWKKDFNAFWREFRVVYQEAQRMGFPLSVLVSGVSSQAFKQESFDGVENAVLHFIPETYLSPFARHASTQMIRDLAKRCGLIFSDEDRNRIAEACGDFPYWIRLAGSFMHRELEMTGRPLVIDSSVVVSVMGDFIESDGVDASRVALEDLRRKYKEPIEVLERAAVNSSLPLAEGKLLLRYGLAEKTHDGVVLQSSMIRAGLESIAVAAEEHIVEVATHLPALHLPTEEWAEELAVINRRRNVLERKLREFIHFTLKLTVEKGGNWTDKVLKSLSERQRVELASLSGDALLGKLYWRDIGVIVTRNWTCFERVLGDRARFESSVELLNDRPDTHAKQVDAADVALYRRELTWLEERLA